MVGEDDVRHLMRQIGSQDSIHGPLEAQTLLRDLAFGELKARGTARAISS